MEFDRLVYFSMHKWTLPKLELAMMPRSHIIKLDEQHFYKSIANSIDCMKSTLQMTMSCIAPGAKHRWCSYSTND